jgi:serine/threonine protein kinase
MATPNIDQSNAAHHLLGRTLTSGWNVIEKLSKPTSATGSFFSVCYKVEKDEQICFLKAFDLGRFNQLKLPGQSIVDVMSEMLDAYRYERDLSALCKHGHVTKVAFVLDSGEEELLEHNAFVVPYLIFDLADGDVRSRMDFSQDLDVAWRLKSLHDMAVGLKQLHKIGVSHQDVKPSNVLLFDKATKLGDLGRSVCDQMEGPHSDQDFSGDYNYAPPEIMYRYSVQDWHGRVKATDCYLLGSMIVYYFCGVSMSALLMKHVPEAFRWERWRGHSADVMPYLVEAFSHALEEFRTHVKTDALRDELSSLLEHLCDPRPERRGHPKTIASTASNYDLERFVARFDLLYTRFQYQRLN